MGSSLIQYKEKIAKFSGPNLIQYISVKCYPLIIISVLSFFLLKLIVELLKIQYCAILDMHYFFPFLKTNGIENTHLQMVFLYEKKFLRKNSVNRFIFLHNLRRNIIYFSCNLKKPKVTHK